jgi:hypothetical protein
MIRRSLFVFLLLCSIVSAFADEPPPVLSSTVDLPDAPSALRVEELPSAFTFSSSSRNVSSLPNDPRDFFSIPRPHPELMGTPNEPFHWKGLLLQSLAFDLFLNSARIAFSTQDERRLLLNKPFWSDYWASLGQYNMRRWNDGDPIAMNYIGHPVEGAVAGYLEIQNNPRDRA